MARPSTTAAVPAAEVYEAARLYHMAVANGAVPYRGHVGTGKESAMTAVCRAGGWNRSAARRRLEQAAEMGLLASPANLPATERPRVRVKAMRADEAPPEGLIDRVAGLLRMRARTTAALAQETHAADEHVEAAIKALQLGGMRIEYATEGMWRLSRVEPAPAYIAGALHTFVTEADNSFTFGASGDQHLGSKYERLDVLNALYDAFAEGGCRVVFNTGNWIDGEARFNVHDLTVRGMVAQMRYLASRYPARPGVVTYAVSGDDHEGWYSQREGIDVGKYAERCFRDAGRDDWIDLGYMEAPVRLVNANTGKEAIISVVHPGGGSAYALSYTMQKFIESLDGGEKPAVVLAGHYHKLIAGNDRNVWWAQTGCCQDQTPFMRKKKLQAHVGGVLCKLWQDPATGAVTRFRPELLRFFNQGYYAGRWSHHGGVQLPARAA